MNNWKRAPINEHLAKYIHAYWYLEKGSEDTSLRFPRLIPNPLTHLIITPMGQSHSYQCGESLQAVEGSHLIMPSSQFIEMDHRQTFIILGVTFKPGIAYSGFQLEPKLMSNRIFGRLHEAAPFIDVQKAESIIRQSSGNPEKTTEILDQLFLPMLDVVRDDNHARLVQKALALFQEESITGLEEQLNCSRRTLERSFSRVTGFTLKQYQSLVRLDSLIQYLYKHRDASQNWAEIALHFGFSDQPHLIRELKKSIGTTPGQYARQGNLTIDAYGDFE